MRKITFLLALLCVSVMGWAIDWGGIDWLGNGGVDGKYSNKIKAVSTPELTGVAFINNLQTNGGYASIHIAMPSAEFGAISLDAADYHTASSGFFPHLDAFKKQETEFTVVCGGTTYTFTVYYEDGEPEDLTGWNIAKGKTAHAGANDASAYRAIDGVKTGDAHRWGSSGAQHYAAVGDAAQDWWYVDLGGFYEISQIKILFETACPNDYDILTSPNGTSWVVARTLTVAPKTGTTDDQYNIYDFSPAKVARYIKVFAREGYEHLLYGFSMWEFEAYGDRAEGYDVNPPTLTSAVVSGSPTANEIKIAVSATDTEDGEVSLFHVIEPTLGYDRNMTAVEGKLTFSGLEENTAYHFTITALDAIGNQSSEIIVNASTTVDPSVPAVVAPIPPVREADDVRRVYSDSYTDVLDHDFVKHMWEGVVEQSKVKDGNNYLIYDMSAGGTVVIWGSNNDGGDAIIAKEAYRAPGQMGLNVSGMEMMHVDIWSNVALSNISVCINDPTLRNISHNGEGWQSYDIELTSPVGNVDLTNLRWMKFKGIEQSGRQKIAIDNVYFWKEPAGSKSVSATPNDNAMGTATVKQNGNPVTEVETGSTVTFSAVANDGYIFVDWSNGETEATFNATVNVAMNLTANFRALNHISCNEEMTNGDYTAFVTYRKTANENEYEFIVRSAQTMTGFSNTYIGHLNGSNQFNLNGQGSLTGNGHKLSYTFTSTTEPKLNTPLYVNFANHGEVTFNQINNGTVFEFAVACADPEITAITLDKTEATLDMGNTLTLVPTFTPAYMSADITWQTSSDAVATVSNGVVTPVAPGSATITAKVTESIKATCSVTVQEAAAHNWYGYGTSQDLDYTYRIEYTTDHHIVAHVKRQGYIVGLVAASMEINKNNVWTTINVTEGEEEGWAKGTTTLTYTAGDNVHILIQSASSGPLSKIEFDYEVGSDNVMPTIVPSTLALSNTSITMGLSDADVQLTAEIHHRDAANKTITWTSDDESVVTVVNGLVHPVGVGTTTIHAATFNGFSASCEVTITGSLVPTTWYGYGTFTPQEGLTGFTCSITRNVDHSLTYTIVLDRDPVGFVGEVNIKDDGVYSGMTYTSSTRTATFTTAANYALDGDVLNKSFWWLKSDNNVDRIDFSYTVGSSNAALPQAVAVDEEKDNSAILTTYNGQTVVGVLGRSFVADNLYTLVLPFDVDAAQTAAKLPGQLTKLNNSYEKANGDLRINFVDASAIEAGVPYLYKPSAAVANPTFEGVEVSAALNPTVADSYAKYYGIYAPMDGNALHAITNAYVLGPDQYLYAVSDLPDNQTMAALRAYFVLNFPAASPGAPKRLAKVVFNENETETTTDIEDLQTDIECTKVIVNGQLQIIRDGKTYNAFGQLVK